jgi:hypothetical protein
MPELPTSESESEFVCDCEEWMRSACSVEPFDQEHEGNQYCVLHFPGNEKKVDFKKALERKIANKDFNFLGVWFPDQVDFFDFDFNDTANFSFATFTADVHFRGSTFRAGVAFSSASFSAAANFSKVSFNSLAAFNGAAFNSEVRFSYATFADEAHFSFTKFNAEATFFEVTFGGKVYFLDSKFSARANFFGAIFKAGTEFAYAIFSGSVDLRKVTFADYVRFEGNKNWQPLCASLDLQLSTAANPDRLSFHTLILRPHWFVNVDCHEFVFTNIQWHGSVNRELRDMKPAFPGRGFGALPQRLLAIACRNLAVNAEDHHRYEEASMFRYMAMDARRSESFLGFAPWRLSWWYWLASGYGERVWQAFFVLLGILLLSALLYNQVGFARWEPKVASESDVIVAKRDDVGAPLKFSRALTYSAGVMTFQKPERRPATTAAQTIVLLETILGPVQAALLALAIRRKFMR